MARLHNQHQSNPKGVRLVPGAVSSLPARLRLGLSLFLFGLLPLAATTLLTGCGAPTAGMWQGTADLGQVVTAVASAELSLQTVVAVRDKVLEAYNEVLKMPV